MNEIFSQTPVSIIICTYNRADSLADTLRSFEGQNIDLSKKVEILVVDNNSTDHTKDVVTGFTSSLPVRYLKETAQGQSFARNRGVAEANGDTILFTDDDVRLDDGWVSAYLDAMGAHPAADFFGGRIVPDWQYHPRPKWLKDEGMALLSGILLAFDNGETTRPYRDGDEGPVGASFGFRRRLFDDLGPFRTDLGPIGTSGGRGDDTEFLDRARARRAQGIYVGEALCWHRVHPNRLTLSGLYRHGVAKGKAHQALTGDPKKGSMVKAADFAVRGTYQLIKGRGDRFRQSVVNIGMEIGKK